MIQLVFRGILKARIESESVVKIAKAYLSQRKIVHITRASVPPITSEHWITTGINCVKVNCDATDFGDGVGWIFWETIVIFFSLKNIYILYVKRSGNKTAIHLARLFVCQPDRIASFGDVLYSLGDEEDEEEEKERLKAKSEANGADPNSFKTSLIKVFKSRKHKGGASEAASSRACSPKEPRNVLKAYWWRLRDSRASSVFSLVL
ncbi:hypothetical protein AgCh_003358 [Apium graveolens]